MKINTVLLFISMFFFLGCSTTKLYKYTEYPCENRTFTTEYKTILVTHGESYMRESMYYLTRNSLQKYEDKTRRRAFTPYIEKKVYEQGSEFQIVGYYWPITTNSFAENYVQYYLIRSFQDNRIAWISSFQFDSKNCRIPKLDYTSPSFSNKFRVYRGSYNEKEIDLSLLKKKEFN